MLQSTVSQKTLAFLWKALLFIVIFSPFLLGMVKFFLLLYYDQKQFVSLTAYGFAIFLGISTMLFNWQRSTKDELLSKKLYRYAVDSLLCCFCFLMAMVSKYFFSGSLNTGFIFFDDYLPYLIFFGGQPISGYWLFSLLQLIL